MHQHEAIGPAMAGPHPAQVIQSDAVAKYQSFPNYLAEPAGMGILAGSILTAGLLELQPATLHCHSLLGISRQTDMHLPYADQGATMGTVP
ncbi:hypothetical protein [Halomonas daqiaonensis]|uniref:hypothetical protein n=1 Tax=Halomonas daqiaonensis TaxID=650850 RepID=UPI001113F4FA|nr:hypothetical protein [Halomonas daqiaonensis]